MAGERLLDQGMNQPWPFRDAVQRLVDFVTEQIDDGDYDTLGWEQLQIARDVVQDALDADTSRRAADAARASLLQAATKARGPLSESEREAVGDFIDDAPYGDDDGLDEAWQRLNELIARDR